MLTIYYPGCEALIYLFNLCCYFFGHGPKVLTNLYTTHYLQLFHFTYLGNVAEALCKDDCSRNEVSYKTDYVRQDCLLGW
jgi:hypothetical protein